MDNFDMGVISDENIKLLEEIGDSSKSKVKILLKENFNTLVEIFTKLNIDDLYEENADIKSDSERMDEEDFNDCSQSENDSDSDSDEESGSEKSDEDSSNREHSDGEKSDHGKKSDNETSNIGSSDSDSEEDTETVNSQ